MRVYIVVTWVGISLTVSDILNPTATFHSIYLFIFIVVSGGVVEQSKVSLDTDYVSRYPMEGQCSHSP